MSAHLDDVLPRLLATLGDQASIDSIYKPNEWNELHIIAVGNQMTHLLNGRVISVLIDEDATKFHGAGKIQGLDDLVGFLLRVAMQRHTSIFMSRIVKGLTQTQFAALAKLREVGPCSQNQLGRLIYLDAATTKGVVDRLEDHPRRHRVERAPGREERERRQRHAARPVPGSGSLHAWRR